MIIAGLIGSTLAAALLVWLGPNRLAARLATALSLVPLAGSLWLWWAYDGGGNALLDDAAFETRVAWVDLGAYTARWHVGVDGVSIPLIALAALLTTLALVAAPAHIETRRSAFYGLMLVLEAALIGVFAALDVLLWALFWEGVLVPIYLLVAVWGGPRRRYAAVKLLVYTNLGSLVLFAGVFVLVFALGDAVDTLSLPAIAAATQAGEVGSLAGLDAGGVRALAFLLLFLGFAVKVPLVPFHTWLPDAHVEAPTPVSVMLAGGLLKMGTYALLRFNFTILPGVAADGVVPAAIATVGVVSVLYGAVLALVQQDLKRVVAYLSVSSMGYVLLGLIALTPHGLGGAAFQMISHGLLSALLFLAVGAVYTNTGTRARQDLSGLFETMPRTAWLALAGAFGYMGLPLMSGFAAELFVFIGAFGSSTIPTAPLVVAAAMVGLIVVAGTLLLAMRQTLFGTPDRDPAPASLRQVGPIAVLLGLAVALGVAPDLIYETIQDGVAPLVPAAAAAGEQPFAARLGEVIAWP